MKYLVLQEGKPPETHDCWPIARNYPVDAYMYVCDNKQWYWRVFTSHWQWMDEQDMKQIPAEIKAWALILE